MTTLSYNANGSKGEEREKEPENIFEDIITENFPNLGKIKQISKSRRHRESQTR